MSRLVLMTPDSVAIRFNLYEREAPVTCEAFLKALPMTARAVQARFAGEEI